MVYCCERLNALPPNSAAIVPNQRKIVTVYNSNKIILLKICFCRYDQAVMNQAVNLWNRHDKFWHVTFFLRQIYLRTRRGSVGGYIRTSVSSVKPLSRWRGASPYFDKQFSGLWTVVVLLSTLARYPCARILNLGDVLFEFVLP